MPSEHLLAQATTKIIEETLGASAAPVPLYPSEAINTVAHVAEKAAHSPELEPPNLIVLLNQYFPHNAVIEFLHHFEAQFFAFIVGGVILVLALIASRNRGLIPNRLQNLFEMVLEAVDSLVCEMCGPRGRKYTPFIVTLFVYIWCMNISGLIPFVKSPTSMIETTFALGICVFCYVQFTAIKENGILGYLHHLCGSPNDLITWMLVPLMMPLHIMEELIKPISLGLRLFGNVMGEDLVIGIFITIGIMMVSFIHSPIGVPLQFPFLLLGILTGTIQAMVFSLLSTIYIFLMLPHEHESSGATEEKHA